MEWVETTGRSVQEAKEAALDELGVDEADAEFEVLAEAQIGLFGRLRSEARVRARVRPTAPRAKEERRDRRDRRRRQAANGDAAPAASDGDGAAAAATETVPARNGRTGRDKAGARASESGTAAAQAEKPGRSERKEQSERGPAERAEREPAAVAASGGPDEGTPEGGPGSSASAPRRNRRRGGSRPSGGGPSEARLADMDAAAEDDYPERPKGPQVEVALERQAEVASDFLTKLTAEFGLEATVTVARPDEDTVELQLTGSDLGILIGPKGATLLAVQNLTRTVVFNETGGNNGHINVDVGGYRQKRTEALIRFATQIADKVKQSGERTALEPMSAIDRKVVHDTISAIDGVSTISEGEEPRRRVVVLPG